MGKIEIYGTMISTPTRAVLIVAKIVGVPYDFTDVHPHEKKQDLKKLGPQEQIPVLVDDGFILPASQAIMQYLVDKYAKDDSLYPKDVKERATVHARLYFDAATLWPRVYGNFRKILYKYLELEPEEGDKDDGFQIVHDSLHIVEEFLTNDKWIAGSKLTIADVSISAAVGLLQAFKFDLSPYPKTLGWLEECKKNIPYYSINDEGIAVMRH